MSTANSTTILTAEEFFDWVHHPENRDGNFELDRGEIVLMPPPGKLHGFICANIVGILLEYARRTQKGYVCSNDAGIIVERDPDTVRGPDISYFVDDQTAETMDRGYPDQPPVLAVEVFSPNDRTNDLMRRVGQMLGGGVRVVWVVDPVAEDMSVNRTGHDVIVLDQTDTLTDEQLLPGFQCSVADFFRVPRGVRPESK